MIGTGSAFLIKTIRTLRKKVGKNNPKTEVVELKKTGITEKIRESVEQNGKKPELFGEIVRAAVALLEKLIAKVMQKIMDTAKKVISKVADAQKETPKETESHVHADDDETVQPEKKKIPFPVNPHRIMDMQDKDGKTTVTVKKSIIGQMKVEQKSVLAKTKRLEEERPPQPKLSVFASKYPRLKEIDSRLKDQNKAIFEREEKRDKLKKELSECTGIFKGGRRKELQQEIDSIDQEISNIKKRLSSIVKEYNFGSVQTFYKELNVAKRENQNYEAALSKYEKTYGEKVADARSVRERIQQKEQRVKDREACRVHQARQKDIGVR